MTLNPESGCISARRTSPCRPPTAGHALINTQLQLGAQSLRLSSNRFNGLLGPLQAQSKTTGREKQTAEAVPSPPRPRYTQLKLGVNESAIRALAAARTALAPDRLPRPKKSRGGKE